MISILATALLAASVTSETPIESPWNGTWVLSYYPVAYLFTIFAVLGVTNAYNIIDGFHGLSSMIGMMTLLALGLVSLEVQDSQIAFLSFSMLAATLGFFIFNFPKGLIFLGDGGAYLIGFWIAVLSVMICSNHQEISPWFALLVNAYPICETIFSIYRRKLQKRKNAGHPDGIHLHSRIFRRILKNKKQLNDHDWFSANAKTSPYLWILSAFTLFNQPRPAVLLMQIIMAFHTFSRAFCGLMHTLCHCFNIAYLFLFGISYNNNIWVFN